MQPIRIFGDPFRTYGAGGGASGILYLLRDEFLTDAAAPLTSPRTCEPGPGTLNFTDVASGRWQVSGGELSLTGSATSGPPAISSMGITRAAGLTFRHRTKQVSASSGTAISPIAGWSSVALNAPLGGALFWGPSFVVIENASGVGATSIDDYTTDTYYDFAHILSSVGGFTFIKLGGVWKLFFPHRTGNNATMYTLVNQSNINRRTPATDYMRVAQLGSPFDTDYGFATDRLAGARAANDTFTHEAGAQWIEFVATTLPSADNIEIEFRRTDANNCWKLQVTSAGAFNLIEVVTGTPNTRATIASNANGDRLLCVMDGSKALLYRMRTGVYATSSVYASVSTFTTQTSGILTTLGTGGAVSDIVTWPRTAAGGAAAELERMS